MSWQDVKAVVQKKQGVKSCQAQQVWWAFLGENIGEEQNGKGEQFLRPVIILKRISYKLCFAIPMTTKILEGKESFTFKFKSKNGKQHIRTALLSQTKALSTKRLVTKMGYITDRGLFKKLKDKLSALLF